MKTINIVSELINGALSGQLSLDELYQTWPEELAQDKFYEIIYNDVESVVEHFPGKLVDHFLKCKDYTSLLVDRKIVNLIIDENPSSDDLVEIRSKLLD